MVYRATGSDIVLYQIESAGTAYLSWKKYGSGRKRQRSHEHTPCPCRVEGMIVVERFGLGAENIYNSFYLRR